MIDRKQLLGTWRLKSWLFVDADGNENYPFGEDAQGYLLYLESGVMSAHLSTAKRTHFTTANLFAITAEEALSSYDTYQSYCGQFEITPNAVLHHVELSTYPNWVGTTQTRFCKIEGDYLYISNQFDDREARLIWEKVR